MSMLPPESDDDKSRISEKPIPSARPQVPVDAGEQVPQGEELFQYVLDCLDKGSLKVEIRKQLIAFGYAAREAEDVVEDVAQWRRRNPDPLSIAKRLDAISDGGVANANMWIGGLACLISIVITLGTCLEESGLSAGFIIAGGAIIWGGTMFFRGLSQRNQA